MSTVKALIASIRPRDPQRHGARRRPAARGRAVRALRRRAAVGAVRTPGARQRGSCATSRTAATFVPRFSPADVEDVHLLRADRDEATRGDRAGVPLGVEVALERLEALEDDAPWDDAVDADLTLHTAIIERPGSPRMMAPARGAWASGGPPRPGGTAHSPRRPVLGPIHRGIVESDPGGCAGRARDVLRTHLEESRDESAESPPSRGTRRHSKDARARAGVGCAHGRDSRRSRRLAGRRGRRPEDHRTGER